MRAFLLELLRYGPAVAVSLLGVGYVAALAFGWWFDRAMSRRLGR